MKGVRSFLGHVEFYRRFIRDFSKISEYLCNLLMKGVPFNFSNDCLQAFETMKKKLITTPIIASPNWSWPFEIICDASDFALVIMLGQRRNKVFQVVYYASWTLTDEQQNYITTEKKLLAIVFSFDKF